MIQAGFTLAHLLMVVMLSWLLGIWVRQLFKLSELRLSVFTILVMLAILLLNAIWLVLA